MCWQPLSLKDPESQDLLNAIGQERALRRRKLQAAQIFHQSAVEDYEFDRFASYGAEDFIMQHLASGAMGRAHHTSRREQIRFRPTTSAQGHPHFVLVSGAPAGAPSSPASSSPAASLPQSSNSEASLATVFGFPHYPAPNRDHSSANSSTIRSQNLELEEHGTASETLDTFKSRVVAASSRYKESLTKSTKGFRERLRIRGGIMQDLGARARDMSAGVARALERRSVEPGTYRPYGSNSLHGQLSENPHHPHDHASDRRAAGSVSAGSPTSNPSVPPNSHFTKTPELRIGAENQVQN